MKITYELSTERFRFHIEQEGDKYFLIVQDKSCTDTLCIQIQKNELYGISSVVRNALV